MNYEVTLSKPDYPRLWEDLWQARIDGVISLQNALQSSVLPGIPQYDYENSSCMDAISMRLYGKKHSFKELVEGYHDHFKDDARLKPYRDIYKDTEPSPILSLKMMMGLCATLAATDLLFYHPNVFINMLPKIAIAVVLLFKLGDYFVTERKGLERYYEVLTSDDSPHSFYLFAAGLALHAGNRDLEHHFMAMTASSLLDPDTLLSEDEKKFILSKLAKERGSHHAAHALWILEQRSEILKAQPSIFDNFHPQQLDNLARKATEKDELARDTLNLVLRCRPDLRKRFLERDNRAVEETSGPLYYFYDLAIDLERQAQGVPPV